MSLRSKTYDAKLEALIKATGKLQAHEIKRVLELLQRCRTEVAARIVETEWQAYRLPELQRAITRAVNQFSDQYGQTQNGILANMWEAGIDMIDGPLKLAGIDMMLPELSRTTLEIMQGYSLDLIGGLSGDLKKRVMGELTNGLLGAKSPYEVMQAIGKNLTSPGVFKSIADRAEAITRTEMGRVHSLSREARIQATVANNPDIVWTKKWHASGKAHPRRWHAQLDGSVEPLDVKWYGFIDYPHAPGLPASEVVNCGCFHTLDTDWDSLPGQWQSMPYHNRAQYE
jgi:hypothetical protein